MKITNVEIVPLSAPYIRPHVPAGHPSNGLRNCVWVRVDTDDRISGWGEAYCGCYATHVTVAALQRIRRSIIGCDPLEPGRTLAEMRFRNRYWAMRGLGAQCTSAIEAALWDIIGKARGRAVWQLLGDGRERPVLLYASAGDSGMPPEAIHAQVREFVERGFRAYKMRCGGRLDEREDRLKEDVDRVRAAREALGPDRMLFVDVAVPQKTPTWTHAKAEAYIRALHPYGVRFIEEPAMTYDVAGYKRLTDLGLVPPAGGESFCTPEEFEPFFESGALGVAQPDAAVVGGPASCVDVIRRAHRAGVPVAVHAWSAGVGIAQNLHASWSAEGVLTMEWPLSRHALASEPLNAMLRFDDGYALPSGLPGLGLRITPEILALHPFQADTERDY